MWGLSAWIQARRSALRDDYMLCAIRVFCKGYMCHNAQAGEVVATLSNKSRPEVLLVLLGLDDPVRPNWMSSPVDREREGDTLTL